MQRPLTKPGFKAGLGLQKLEQWQEYADYNRLHGRTASPGTRRILQTGQIDLLDPYYNSGEQSYFFNKKAYPNLTALQQAYPVGRNYQSICREDPETVYAMIEDLVAAGVVRPLLPSEVPLATFSPLGLDLKPGSDKVRLTFHHAFIRAHICRNLVLAST